MKLSVNKAEDALGFQKSPGSSWVFLSIICKDRAFLLALFAGFLCWSLLWLVKFDGVLEWAIRPVSIVQFFLVVIVFPVLEEIVFRGFLQSWLLQKRFPRRCWLGISLANLLTSVAFAAFHLLNHSLFWALAVFLPSLVFGFFRERYQSIRPSIFLHGFYNFGSYLVFVG